MGVGPLGRQGGPLRHAEPVLLVCDHQPQPVKDHPFGQQGVGAHDEIDVAGGQICLHLLLDLPPAGSRLSRPTRTPLPASSLVRERACCSASSSVGAIMAACQRRARR